MKTIRLARLALALTPLSLGLVALTSLTPAFSAPPTAAASTYGLPPGTPPLTAAQRQKQQARIQRYVQDANAVSTNPSLTPIQKRQQVLALQTSLRTDMLNILTPKQRAMVQAQNNRVLALKKLFAQQHKAEISELQTLNVQLAALNTATYKAMTPQQKQKITLIQQQAQGQIQKLQGQNSPAQVKQQTAAAIVRDAQRQMLSVLSPAQQASLRQLQDKVVALQTRLGEELTAFAKAHGQQ